MAHANQFQKPERLSSKTFRRLSDAIQACRDEGFNCWGFIFKDFGEDSIFDMFTSHEEPLPVFIVRTEAAIVVMRERVPEEFNLEEQERAVAEYLSGKVKRLPDGKVKGKIMPHLITSTEKVN